ncbi:Ribonuclease YxiD [Bacillus pumilus]
MPHVDESAFQQSYQKALLETSRTIGLLHAFDREQTSAMNETTSALQTMKQYINTLSTMFTGPKIEITSYQKGSIFKDTKEEKVRSTISGLNDKIDNPKDNPMMIMLKKLGEKEQANVRTVVHRDTLRNVNKQVKANDPWLTTLQKEVVSGKSKILRDIRVVNGKLYNVKGIKKLKEFDIADEVITDPSDIDFIGGRYTVYANKQIIRTYIANDEVRIEEVDNIPESRSHGNAKRILDDEVVSTAENIILEYSGIYDGYRAVTGKDPETSENISSTDQALSAASIIPFMKIIKGGKYVFKIDQGKNVVKRVEKIAKGAGELNKDLAKAYLRDIEAKTGRKVNKDQIHLIKEALRNKNYEKLTPKETAKHRSKFTSSLKDKLIAEWEEKTKQKWPRYTEEVLDKNGEVARRVGQPYDAHHIIENNFGGAHEWWNIHPAKYPNEHQSGIHGKGAPSGKLFPRR